VKSAYLTSIKFLSHRRQKNGARGVSPAKELKKLPPNLCAEIESTACILGLKNILVDFTILH
jgi:hypothetical protein